MTKQLKISLALVAAFVVAIAALLAINAGNDSDGAPPVEAGESRLVRADSHIVGPEGSTDVTFVEFLDFECEGCLAAYPAIEQLRKEYEGRVTFVVRHFPLHFNSERAARAAEAAARQDKFEKMYQRLFDTQTQWGHQQEPADEVFRGHAEDLGLDMDQFDADYTDPATAQRVARDVADGESLGVQGTPTFFINGEQFQPQSFDDLKQALDDALAG